MNINKINASSLVDFQPKTQWNKLCLSNSVPGPAEHSQLHWKKRTVTGLGEHYLPNLVIQFSQVKFS